MAHDMTLPAALYRANQELGQRVSRAVLENQRRWFDLGMRQFGAASVSESAALHGEDMRESANAIQDAFCAEVQEVLIQWQRRCAELLPATDAGNRRRHSAGELG